MGEGRSFPGRWDELRAPLVPLASLRASASKPLRLEDLRPLTHSNLADSKLQMKDK